ncbi:hypothetical protein CYMTET_54899, partial [Cymbomonas tetramitiformis]
AEAAVSALESSGSGTDYAALVDEIHIQIMAAKGVNSSDLDKLQFLTSEDVEIDLRNGSVHNMSQTGGTSGEYHLKVKSLDRTLDELLLHMWLTFPSLVVTFRVEIRLLPKCAEDLDPTACAIALADCPPGALYLSAQKRCDVRCPTPGYGYSETGECSICSAGTYSTGVACQQCEPGMFSHAGASACNLCARGTYQPDAGRVECIDCPRGTYADRTGSVTCQACVPHSTTSASVAATRWSDCDCFPGYEQEVSRSVNSSLPSACVPCGELEIKPEPGPQSCTTCPEGSFAANSINTTSGAFVLDRALSISPVCTCGPGKQPVLGADGAWLIEGTAGQCEDCSAGTYRESILAHRHTEPALCLGCPQGHTYSGPETACTKCPAGFLKLTSDVEAACEPCSDEDGTRIPGVMCPGGSVYYVDQGYFVSPNAEHCTDEKCLLQRVYECYTHDACTVADKCGDAAGDHPGGGCGGLEAQNRVGIWGGTVPADFNPSRMGSSFADVSSLEICNSVNYADVALCGGSMVPVCAEGYHLAAGDTSCEKCPSAAVIFPQAIAIVVLLLLLLVGLVKLFSLFGQDTSAKDVEQMQLASAKLLSARGAINILIGYVQVVSQVSMMFSRNLMPRTLEKFTESLRVFNLNLSYIIDVKCLAYHTLSSSSTHTSGFMTSFWSAVVMPYAVLALVCATYLVKWWCHKPLLNPAAEIRWRRIGKRTSAAIWLFLMFTIHPGISTTVFQLYNCDEVEFQMVDIRQKWLRLDMSVECFRTSSWIFAAAFSVFTMITYVFGYPAALMYFMWRLRQYVHMSIKISDLNRLRHLVKDGACHFVEVEDQLWYDALDQSISYEEHIETRLRGDRIELYLLQSQYKETSEALGSEPRSPRSPMQLKAKSFKGDLNDYA